MWHVNIHSCQDDLVNAASSSDSTKAKICTPHYGNDGNLASHSAAQTLMLHEVVLPADVKAQLNT